MASYKQQYHRVIVFCWADITPRFYAPTVQELKINAKKFDLKKLTNNRRMKKFECNTLDVEPTCYSLFAKVQTGVLGSSLKGFLLNLDAAFKDAALLPTVATKEQAYRRVVMSWEPRVLRGYTYHEGVNVPLRPRTTEPYPSTTEGGDSGWDFLDDDYTMTPVRHNAVYPSTNRTLTPVRSSTVFGGRSPTVFGGRSPKSPALSEISMSHSPISLADAFTRAFAGSRASAGRNGGDSQQPRNEEPSPTKKRSPSPIPLAEAFPQASMISRIENEMSPQPQRRDNSQRDNSQKQAKRKNRPVSEFPGSKGLRRMNEMEEKALEWARSLRDDEKLDELLGISYLASEIVTRIQAIEGEIRGVRRNLCDVRVTQLANAQGVEAVKDLKKWQVAHDEIIYIENILPFKTDEEVNEFFQDGKEKKAKETALYRHLYVNTAGITCMSTFLWRLFHILFTENYICKKRFGSEKIVPNAIYNPLPECVQDFISKFEQNELTKEDQFAWYNDLSKHRYITARNRFFSETRGRRQTAKKQYDENNKENEAPSA